MVLRIVLAVWTIWKVCFLKASRTSIVFSCTSVVFVINTKIGFMEFRRASFQNLSVIYGKEKVRKQGINLMRYLLNIKVITRQIWICLFLEWNDYFVFNYTIFVYSHFMNQSHFCNWLIFYLVQQFFCNKYGVFLHCK